ncbi:ephrin-A4 isoform X1 [Mus caroli]|uniref:Ephrin-A4 n=1 Tax=Mus caroli TaxID=10089 RepID=A0A6P7QP03_MUSCR|nr:ephrin-A4 isoform X1 [Mus caroli]
MRLLPLLRTVLWAALLGSRLPGCSSLRHPIYWNSSNPRLLRGDAVVELGLNDYLDIFCPHYESPGPPEGPETFTLYMVDRSGYEACMAEGANAFQRWKCSMPFVPFGPVRFSEKIQRYTPFSLGFEFLPGETYYYISVPTPESPGRCLRLQVSVCCKESVSSSLGVLEKAVRYVRVAGRTRAQPPVSLAAAAAAPHSPSPESSVSQVHRRRRRSRHLKEPQPFPRSSVEGVPATIQAMPNQADRMKL